MKKLMEILMELDDSIDWENPAEPELRRCNVENDTASAGKLRWHIILLYIWYCFCHFPFWHIR